MPSQIEINLITYDAKTDEFVLYLVEDGPWPSQEADWISCLRLIQNRILAAADVAIDGHLIGKFPDAAGKAVRIQVDSPSGCPGALEDLIVAVRRFLVEDASYRTAIAESAHLRALRIVSGKEIGRFFD